MKPMMPLVCIVASIGSVAAGNQVNDRHHEGGSMTATLELPQATPEEVGMSGKRLNRVSDVVQEFIEEGRIQGAVVGVARRGKVVYFEAQGVANVKTEAPLQMDAMFNMASSTKPILGVAAMMVIEEGKLKPSDPVERYIPEFRDIKVAVLDEAGKEQAKSKKASEYRLVDVESFRHHSRSADTHSGIAGLARSKGAKRPKARDRNETLATWIPKVAAGPLSFQPGTQWGYGGGLEVVARIIEIVSGMPFNEFVQERIFDPLDMKDTHWILAS